MFIRNVKEIETNEVEMEGVEGTHIQWLASKKEGAPNFAMRRFRITPGGTIPLHDHKWEHEIYILSGKGIAYNEKQRSDVGPGDVLFIPGDEPHGYDNTGEEDLVFICMIPNSGDPR